MTVINMAADLAAVVNEDVFFSDDDKEAKLDELLAQNQCLYETTSEEYKDRSKRSQAYQCLIEFRSKSAERGQISVSVVSRFLPKHVVAIIALRLRLLNSQNKKNNKNNK